MAAEHLHGNEVLGPLYTALGTRYHNLERPRTRETIEEALIEVGLPIGLADAMGSAEWDDAVQKTHQEAVDLVGLDVGTPVISVQDVAFFGPVVTPSPKGQDVLTSGTACCSSPASAGSTSSSGLASTALSSTDDSAPA